MRETFKMMEKILTGKENKKDEKELIKEYQEKLSPNILAYFYCNNFKLISKIANKYKVINDEDIASFCLQELDKCLQLYDYKKALFITYFIKCFKIRLAHEYMKLNLQKRKANINCIDYDLLKDIKVINKFSIDFILNDYKLNSYEKEQCKLLVEGYTITEIAKKLKVSISTITYRNKKIKQKILAII